MYKQLTREQRYAIQLGLQEGATLKIIAARIGVNKSTVSREIRRNSNRHGRYLYREAEELAQVRRERSTANRATPRHVLSSARGLLVREQWSPRQISGYLRTRGIRISHERIYRMIREDATGELRRHTRHGMKYRRRNPNRKQAAGRTLIPMRVSIHDRPAAADGRRFGDWEMDLVVGKGQRSALLVLAERSTNFLLLARLPDKKSSTVYMAAWRLLVPYKGDPLKTITTDNGVEFLMHRELSKKLNVPVYFADPYCSWQKGAVENTNKLIRQYFPKGTDFNSVSDLDVKYIQHKLNKRPREKLNFMSPKDVFFNSFR